MKFFIRFSLMLLSVCFFGVVLSTPHTHAVTINEFTIPTIDSRPTGITAGSDGDLWFTESFSNKIGRITTAGVITEFMIPTVDSTPWDITAGPDGNLWFTESFGNKIGRITTAGVISEFRVPFGPGLPLGITAGPDGNLWFTEFVGNRIGQVTQILPPITAVPAMSEWGMITLVISLGRESLYYLKRRKAAIRRSFGRS